MLKPSFLLKIALCALLFLSARDALAAKKTIAVLPFTNATHYSGQLFGGGLDENLITELVKSRTYQVVERSRLNAVLREQRLGATGLIDPATAAQIGRLLGADYLLSGSIIYAGIDSGQIFAVKAKVTLAVQLVDVQTGQITFAEKLDGHKSASAIHQEYAPGRYRYNMNLPQAKLIFTEAAHRAAQKIINALYEVNPLEGYVVAVDKNTVIIDIGREHGAAANQKYLIYREGEPIYHPVHNTLIAMKRTDIATCRVKSVDATVAYCHKIDFIDGEYSVQPGDKVRIHTGK